MRPPLQPVAPRIDDPIELLLACHDKVRRFADLTLRLRDHVAARGADVQAREAATSVLRYFDIAAPLHHADEEADLFPALRRIPHAELAETMSRLEREHQSLAMLWQTTRAWLLAVQAGQALPAPADIADFASRYVAHAGSEEAEVYPHAGMLDQATLKAISQAMVARRTAPAPGVSPAESPPSPDA